MKRLSVLMIVSTLVVGTTGCRQCNWFGRPYGAAMMPATTCCPTMPAATYADPGVAAPVTSPGSCGPGCNSCSGNTLPILSGAQGYASAPAN